jgi:hypothetical protein
MAYIAPGTAVAGGVYTAAAHNIIVNDVIDLDARFALLVGLKTSTITTGTTTQNAGESLAETARQTSTAIATLASHQYLIIAYQTIFTNDAQQFDLRIRRGTTTSGTLVGRTRTMTSTTGGNTTLIAFAIDTPGAQASQQYCTTVQAGSNIYNRVEPNGIIVIDIAPS